MNVALIGASGMIGSRILNELLTRGHHVTAISRHATKVDGVPYRHADLLNHASIAKAIHGIPTVISAYSPPASSPSDLLLATQSLIAAHPKRLLVVSGAGSLDVTPGHRLVDTPDFPASWKPIALAHVAALDLLQKSNLDWTCLSPAALIEPGIRSGKFRLGQNLLLTDAKGQSRISAEDFAVALVDELEKPQHSRSRFTLAY
ncbi:NAD(P)-dependent oxidoreductase [Bryobacter aggregatus]|uniref:NAD(P)-dependent oxidoreductase n=1 Tax=Bryobacter aggregatus TaxID=360054 RepID=UPI0004E194BB|nr:NAD(P)-dependent oxidoreductase [Bryobacter aggregatus]